MVRVLVIFLVLYFGFRLFIRYIAPLLLKMFVNTQLNKQSQRKEHQEGRVDIDYEPQKNKPSKEGEYIDYEEVK